MTDGESIIVTEYKWAAFYRITHYSRSPDGEEAYTKKIQ